MNHPEFLFRLFGAEFGIFLFNLKKSRFYGEGLNNKKIAPSEKSERGKRYE